MRDVKDAISLYHAHVYFQLHTEGAAMALRSEIENRYGSAITMHPPAQGPRGPHVNPMFGLDLPCSHALEVIGFLMLNHGPLAVLIHPVTENELLDHTHHALWLGTQQPLNLAILA
jgi:aromatic ring-cleaving dioxygenase